MAQIYLDIKEKAFQKFRDDAISLAKNNEGDDYEDGATYKDIDFDVDDYEFNKDTGELTIYGWMEKEGTNMGFIDLKLNLNNVELGTHIIDFFMKRLGKLKTVLEATK